MFTKIAISTAVLLASASMALANEAVVAEATGGKFKAMKGTYTDLCGEIRPYEAELVDLNGDTQPEVFVTKEGTCEGGRNGAVVMLFVKTGKVWNEQFATSGQHQVMKTKTKGYSDVEIGGGGRCFPLYKWNGAKYALSNQC